MRTGFEGFKLAIGGFIVPFIFVYHPALILQGPWEETIWIFLLGCACIILTSAALEGWLFGPASWIERILMLLAAVGLVAAMRQIVIGSGLLAVALVGWQVARYGWRGAPAEMALKAEP